MNLSLKANNFLAHVYFKNHKVFDLILRENNSEVKFCKGRNTRKNTISIHRINKVQNPTFSQAEFEGSVRTLFAEMRFKYQGFWSETDKIGVVTKSAKTLLYEIYGPLAMDVSITSNFDSLTPLKTMMDER